MSDPSQSQDLPQDGDLQALWKSGRATAAVSASTEDAAAVRARIAQLVRQPQRVSINEQVAAVIILSILLVILVLFFRYVSPLESYWSGMGVGFMLGSTAGRVLIECAGIYYARRISLFDSTADFVRTSWRFLEFRRNQVHRFIVAFTLALYTLGYYLLLPEYALYFSTPVVWLLGVSYPVIMGGIIFLAIRPGMQRERVALNELEALVWEVSTGAG